jgi:4-diphosphocytidyl-2-C-methyl-D-erythritol kinase
VFTLQAQAKINWFLLIRSRRDDGFHDIQTLMQRITLADTLTFEESDHLEIISSMDIPAEDNLVWRAAMLLKEHASVKKGARITLEKTIPIEAGLGGGSSDAASTLSGLNRFWNIGLSTETLMALAARIGSDVPFFLGPPAAEATGRGDIIAPVDIKRPWTLLIAKPDFGVSASWAYQNAKERADETIDCSSFARTLDAGDFVLLEDMMMNHLEPPVIEAYPEIWEIIDQMSDVGARASAMSGSGTAVYGVFNSEEEAQRAMLLMAPYWCVMAETVVESPQ